MVTLSEITTKMSKMQQAIEYLIDENGKKSKKIKELETQIQRISHSSVTTEAT